MKDESEMCRAGRYILLTHSFPVTLSEPQFGSVV